MKGVISLALKESWRGCFLEEGPFKLGLEEFMVVDQP